MVKVPRVVYTDAYEVDIGGHVFPTEKYRLIKDLLVKKDGFQEGNFIKPDKAGDEDILLVHTKSYLEKLKSGKMSLEEQQKLELPFSKELVDASLLCVDGSIQAGRIALKEKIGIHLGGGFHHAFPDHGEGFCVFNDIAVMIRRLKKDGLINKAMVIDCDLHQGNGTAFIFKDDKDVFTFSIHQENNYPTPKPPSKLDVGLEDGAGDKRYLEELSNNIPNAIKGFKPDLVVYVAGADPYERDQIGNLGLSIDGLKKRDEFVFQICDKFKVPVSVVLAGGYAIDKTDTATIHYTTVKTGLKYAG